MRMEILDSEDENLFKFPHQYETFYLPRKQNTIIYIYIDLHHLQQALCQMTGSHSFQITYIL